MAQDKKISIEKGLKLKAKSDSLHFRSGDIIAGPLAFIYVAGRAFSSVGAYIGQGLLWLGGRAVEGVSPRFHRWALDKIERSYEGAKDWIAGHLNNPKVAFGISFPLILSNISVALGATALAAGSLFMHISHELVVGATIAAKFAKLSLPITYTMWGKAEGSKGHAKIHPVFQSVGMQLQRLDDYVEELIPVYKRTKELLQKAPLTTYEEKILESMPHFLRHIPKMERAGILAHHMVQTALELAGKKPVDERYLSMTQSGAAKSQLTVFGMKLSEYEQDSKGGTSAKPLVGGAMVRDVFTKPYPLDESLSVKASFDAKADGQNAGKPEAEKPQVAASSSQRSGSESLKKEI